MINRRSFLTTAAAGFTASLALHKPLLAQLENVPSLPGRALFDKNEDAYWAALRKQFLIPEDEIYLNNGTVGSSPAPVLRAIFEGYTTTEKMDQQDPEDYPIWGYAAWNEFRDPLAEFVGCHRDEIALLRNATEGNSYIANGLDLKPGDEVLTTDQEHPGGIHPWNVKAKRYGIVVKQITLPRPVNNAAQVLNLFNDAITPRTRIIFFSHITTFSGVVLPAKEICGLARSKGLLSAVDGAHVPGMMRLNIGEIGCDMYSASPHKWLMAPKGTGTLYIREERMKDLWVNIATANWNNYDLKAYRFSWFGTSNLSVMVGLKAALEFHRTIGPEIVFARIHELAKQVHDKVAAYPQLRITNASADQFYGGMVSFDLVKENAKGDLKKVVDGCAARNIRIVGGPDHFRVSTHIFTQPTELDLFYDALSEGLA